MCVRREMLSDQELYLVGFCLGCLLFCCFCWVFFCYLIEINHFIYLSCIANLIKTCRMPDLRKGILFHVLLSYYPLLTLVSALEVNNVFSQRWETFFCMLIFIKDYIQFLAF